MRKDLKRLFMVKTSREDKEAAYGFINFMGLFVSLVETSIYKVWFIQFLLLHIMKLIYIVPFLGVPNWNEKVEDTQQAD